MPLKAVLIDRETLIAHGNWKEPLQELLLGLYKHEVSVLDLSAGNLSVGRDFLPQDCLFIADCEETVQQAKKWNMAVLGYEPPGEMGQTDVGGQRAARISSPLPMLVEGFEEVDFYFLERVYQRFHHLPWIVVETKRCFLREITLEDLDALYELYQPVEITRYMDGLYEEREKEEAYTKAYIDHMYRFYGYGLWAVIEKESGRLIGRAGLSHLEVEGEVQLEMGYVIAKDKQNQGYATEVCLGVLDYAKEATDFRSIHCLIQKENRISVHLALKLGFRWDKSVICNGKEMQRYSKILQS